MDSKIEQDSISCRGGGAPGWRQAYWMQHTQQGSGVAAMARWWRRAEMSKRHRVRSGSE